MAAGHTVPAVTFWGTHRAKMSARNDKGMMGIYFMNIPMVVCCYNNESLWFEILILYFIYTPLLVIIHIPYTQKWAGGHRCSLRHNVCHPATARLQHHTIYKQKRTGGCRFLYETLWFASIFWWETHRWNILGVRLFWRRYTFLRIRIRNQRYLHHP